MAEMTNEERLFKVFSNVNDWLKFAEAKNAMMLAFNAASIYGITKTYDLELVKDNSFLSYYLFFVIVQLAFSSICALISFAPRVKIIKGGYYASGNIANTLFFEYLKTKTTLEIMNEINKTQYDLKENLPPDFEKDIAEQIRQNSIIASRKYSYFTIAVWITISAYITFPLAGIFCLYTYLKD